MRWDEAYEGGCDRDEADREGRFEEGRLLNCSMRFVLMAWRNLLVISFSHPGRMGLASLVLVEGTGFRRIGVGGMADVVVKYATMAWVRWRMSAARLSMRRLSCDKVLQRGSIEIRRVQEMSSDSV